MEMMYTWIPAYSQIVQKLLTCKDKQSQLLADLKQIGADVFNDKDVNGESMELDEIDPFTFICYLNKYGDLRRKKMLRLLCQLWEIDVDVKDVCGIPTSNPQKLWLFPYKGSRTNDEINRLWAFFDKLVANKVTDEDFVDVLSIHSVGLPKITEGMFMVNPKEFLCLNGAVRPYVAETIRVPINSSSFTELKNSYERIKIASTNSFPEISYKAYLDKITAGKPVSYFRIGSTDGESGISILPEMIENNVVSIGWPDLGDLEDYEPLNKTSIKDGLSKLNIYKDKGVETRKAGEIFNFYKDIKPNDIVIVAEGSSVKAIGKVISDNYVFEPELDFPHCKNVEWLKTGITDLEVQEGLRTSVWRLEWPDTLKSIKEYLNINIDLSEISTPSQMHKKNLMNLNTILYGPPGTSKTFCTIEKAVKIIDPDFDFGDAAKRDDRKRTKEKFDELYSKNNIKFITFHQSLSYEDFIEGIKPVLNQDQLEKTDLEQGSKLSYTIKPGLFKEASAYASFLCYKKWKNANSDAASKNISFNMLYDAFVEHLQVDLDNGKQLRFQTLRGNPTVVIRINRNDSIITQAKESKRKKEGQPKTKENFQKLYDNIKNIDEVTTLEPIKNLVDHPGVSGLYALFKGLKEFEKTFVPGQVIEEEESAIEEIIKQFEEGVYTDAVQELSAEAERVVLVIDEINRGNIAAIFGELITLIEETKRWGNKEYLKLRLPYSGKHFFVPANLYIIGTMNTADRSVEALDTALRRRFSFEFMGPRDEMVPETIGESLVPLRKIFKCVNERIAYLIDKDHQIGHSYFIDIQDENELKEVFKNKIVPLLKEYFFNDYGKIRLVLGNGFVKKKDNYIPTFAVRDNTELNRDVFIIEEIDEKFDLINALKEVVGEE